MKFPGQQNYKLLITGFSFMETLVTLGVLFSGLLLTALSVIYTRNNIQRAAMQDFEYSCNDLRIKIETRLNEHALLLRSGEALFAVSDSVTSDMWHRFYIRTRIDQFLPGIQGFGYSKVIYPDDLENHIRFFRSLGFTQYEITPKGKREIYTSIIYLEPFTGRNLLAFGYDMFSEPVRRKAMEIARDSNIAMLSGKVTLVQETGQDVQAGVLMYIPVFRDGMPSGTVEERRKAIAGWVYSPYRMNDLMHGIQGREGISADNPIKLRIYDDDLISEEALLYESRNKGNALNIRKQNLSLQLPVVFNNKRWTLVFSGRKEEMSIFHKGQVVIWTTGVVISILLFVLSTMQINANIRSRQIGELNRQLEKLNADKSRFIAILSHDLKSPFTSILGFLELLMTGIRKYSIDQIESHIHIINESARNTYNLLEDLLTWIRAHSGKIPFNPQLISFRENYDNVLEILLPLGESKNINIECHETGNVMLYADKDMLKTIMRNLLSNAIKFTRPGGSIKITAEKQPGRVMISVADTGTGMKEQQLENLFDISKIYSTTGTGGEKGSGLGLVICREFIETHGGKIWAVSEFGKGSDFRFTMPDKHQTFNQNPL
jgi:signal transduction histidine kinase